MDLHILLQKFIKSAYSYCVDVEFENVRIEVALARSVENLLQVRQKFSKFVLINFKAKFTLCPGENDKWENGLNGGNVAAYK